MSKTEHQFVVVRGMHGQPIKLDAFTSGDERTPTCRLYKFDEESFFNLRNAYQFARKDELEELWEQATTVQVEQVGPNRAQSTRLKIHRPE